VIADEAWKSARDSTSLADACERIKESIKETHREYAGIYQPGQMPVTEIVYGVKMHQQSKLFYAYGPAVSESDKYVIGGVGQYLADFLSSRMYDEYFSVRHAIILAAYVLFQAKEHLEGCGGASHIAVLRNEGSSGKVSSENVESITKLVEVSDAEIGKLLIHYADMGSSREEFMNKANEVLVCLMSIREHEERKVREHKSLWKALFGSPLHDEIGLPVPYEFKPSTSQTEEPEQ
jgi:hypothetical protein